MLITTIALITSILTFLFEGITHGLQNKVLNKAHNSLKLSKRWHTTNSLFIAFITVSTLFLFLNELQRYDSIGIWYSFSKEMFIDMGIVGIEIILFRFIFFAYIRNIFAGNDIGYIGDTSNGDSFYNKYIMRFIPPSFILMTRVFVLIALIAFLYS